MRKLAVLIIVALVCLSIAAAGCGESEEPETKKTSPKSEPVSTAPPAPPFQQQTFENVKSAHYVSSDPANNALLTSPPAQVTIFFNFNLGTNNYIKVTRDGADVNSGALAVAPDKLSMSQPVSAGTTGNYKVDYQASWPDGSYHFGSFGFSVQLP